MAATLEVESTLTDRYQTTVPETVRRALQLGKRDKIVTADFTMDVYAKFEQLAQDFLSGTAPFRAEINPEVANYGDYDQLMRLEEWYGRDDG